MPLAQMSTETTQILAPVLPMGSAGSDELERRGVRVASRPQVAQHHSWLCPGRSSTMWPKFRCCSGVSIRQRSKTKKSAARQVRAASPVRICRNIRANEAFGAPGRASRRKQGGHASFPSSSVTHSRQKVPPQCGHLAAASRSGWNKQRAWRKPVAGGFWDLEPVVSGAIRLCCRCFGSHLNGGFRGFGNDSWRGWALDDFAIGANC